ncbi:DCN1 protein 1 [Trichuris trichiura]|uniref:Defective in cullin neddylation protein n=1 Tax=Trichuris trichiura TaxID=36087 RepID=A0A077YXT9_TRITR|nr:DCN1 protein 1 [Trichuris trichiura]
MYKLKHSQKEKVRSFVQLTHASEKVMQLKSRRSVAVFCLNRNDWRLDSACDMYFSHPELYGATDKHAVDRQKVEALFEKYADQYGQFLLCATVSLHPVQSSADRKIGPSGVEAFLKDLHLSSDDLLVLVLAWKMRAKTQCEFTKNEFVNGLLEMRCDTIEKLRNKLEKFRTELQDEDNFRDFYQFTFLFAKSPTQKGLALIVFRFSAFNSQFADVEMAIGYWRLILAGRFFHLDNWCNFLQSARRKPITRDTWNLVLDFSKVICNDLSNYDTQGAWPTLLDEFVEYMRKNMEKQNMELQ